MSEREPAALVSGSCLCGTVRYEAAGPFSDLRYCHCERCRKATGSAHAANLFVAKEHLRWIAGEEAVVVFRHPEADDYPRGFCRVCGSMVPRLARDGRSMAIPAGSLDSDPGVRPSKNIFWALRAPWFVATSELPTHDAKP
jgi:hypothetical protein